MTRQEFLDEINSFSDLLDFCNQQELYTMENVVYDLASNISEDLRDYAYEYSWTEIRDWLDQIYDGGNWYRRDGSFDYFCIDDYFEEWKRDVLEYADRAGAFDEEDEDEEYGDDEDERVSICNPRRSPSESAQDEELFTVPSADWMPCAGEIREAASQYKEAALRADAAIREIKIW